MDKISYLKTVEQILNSPDFIKWIKELDLENKIKKKLHSPNSNDPLNIFALYYEVKTGYLLKKTGFKVTYEDEVANKKPDWLIEKNNQKIYLEVKNLNLKKIELDKRDYITKLKDEIEKIKEPYGVNLYFDITQNTNQYFKQTINEIISEFSLWLEKRSENDKKFHFNGINIDITRNHKASKILVDFFSGDKINYDSRRTESALKEKLNKYSEILFKNNFGFIIAIVSDVVNGTIIKDVKNIVYSNPSRKEAGLFDSNTYKDKINGVLWMRTCDDNFNYLPNYNNSKEVNELF